MNRYRVVSLGVNAVVVQKFQEGVALLGLFRFNNVEVVHMSAAAAFEWQAEILCPFQAGGIARRPFAAQIVPRVDVLELGAQNAGVQIVQPAVESEAVEIAAGWGTNVAGWAVRGAAL